MIRRQRKTHLRVWTVLAVFLPASLAVILSLAASQVVERAPVRLDPLAATEGTGGRAMPTSRSSGTAPN